MGTDDEQPVCKFIVLTDGIINTPFCRYNHTYRSLQERIAGPEWIAYHHIINNQNVSITFRATHEGFTHIIDSQEQLDSIANTVQKRILKLTIHFEE